MKPNEKAKQLIDKYYFTLVYQAYDEDWNTKAKQCALRAVDEILASVKDVFEHCWNHTNWNGEYDLADYKIYISYWQEVKQEIENYRQ